MFIVALVACAGVYCGFACDDCFMLSFVLWLLLFGFLVCLIVYRWLACLCVWVWYCSWFRLVFASVNSVDYLLSFVLYALLFWFADFNNFVFIWLLLIFEVVFVCLLLFCDGCLLFVFVAC